MPRISKAMLGAILAGRSELIKTLIIVGSQPAAPGAGPAGRDAALSNRRKIADYIPQWSCFDPDER